MDNAKSASGCQALTYSRDSIRDSDRSKSCRQKNRLDHARLAKLAGHWTV